MSDGLNLETYGNRLLTSVVTGHIMPENEFSNGKYASYRGASSIMNQLLAGDWDVEGRGEYFKEYVGEFLARVVANAERQGITIPDRADAPPPSIDQ
jgi:hypothetical protein